MAAAVLVWAHIDLKKNLKGTKPWNILLVTATILDIEHNFVNGHTRFKLAWFGWKVHE
jgi:hypothetical protein